MVGCIREISASYVLDMHCLVELCTHSLYICLFPVAPGDPSYKNGCGKRPCLMHQAYAHPSS
jgi:hypothetical protein